MAKDQLTEILAIKFFCHKCGKENVYSNLLAKSSSKTGPITLVKKCMTCGSDNLIEAPPGRFFEKNDTIYRGD